MSWHQAAEHLAHARTILQLVGHGWKSNPVAKDNDLIARII